MIQCSAAGFDLEGELWPTHDDNYQFHNRGNTFCGCPQATGVCAAQTAGIAPPPPLDGPP
jgi:hypothetical protein